MPAIKNPSAEEPHAALVSTADLRGVLWAERIARQLMLKWPRWKRTPRALSMAGRQIADLARGDVEVYARLALVAYEAASKRFSQIVAGGRTGSSAEHDASLDEEMPK